MTGSSNIKTLFKWPTAVPDELSVMIRTYVGKYTIVLYTFSTLGPCPNLDPDTWHEYTISIHRFDSLAEGKISGPPCLTVDEIPSDKMTQIRSLMDFDGYIRGISKPTLLGILMEFDKVFLLNQTYNPTVHRGPRQCQICKKMDEYASESSTQGGRVVCYSCFKPTKSPW
jgi:hypothetical protein